MPSQKKNKKTHKKKQKQKKKTKGKRKEKKVTLAESTKLNVKSGRYTKLCEFKVLKPTESDQSVVYWPPTRPNMPFQRRRKCIFHWRRRAWRTIWDRVKIQRYSHKLMHRKMVTCEQHDSCFRSMMIKTYHSKGVGVELLYNSVHRKFKQFGDQSVGDKMW